LLDFETPLRLSLGSLSFGLGSVVDPSG
jgi:hypothetical protein